MDIYTKYDQEGNIIDLIVSRDQETISMLGYGGKDREKNIVSRFLSLEDKAKSSKKMLPVLLGSGAGYALNELLEKTEGPIAVIDKEVILHTTKLQQRITDERVFWICTPNFQDVLSALTQWQEFHGGIPMTPLVHPFYMQLDKTWYQQIRQYVQASARFDFWGKAIQPRFKGKDIRLLLITTRYFLLGAIEEACSHLGLQHHVITVHNKETGCTAFIEELLHTVVTFRPDCVLTINHFGVDKEGVLVNLLEKLQLPMASWFVDNPHLIIHEYSDVVSPWTTLFTWDEDNLLSLKDLGYNHVYYLPLGTSPYSFRSRNSQDIPLSNLFPTDVSFVGNSMVYKVEERLAKGNFSSSLLKGYHNIAQAFAESEEHSIQRFLQEAFPELYTHYLALPHMEQRLAYEAMLTWESTLQYRSQCIEQLLDFHPVIVGDDGWKKLLRHHNKTWYHQLPVNYYTELPYVYMFSEVSFNCTSKQMKGAVNQRVFDVPATGSFLITDWQRQLEALFEPKKEVIAFYEPEEAKDLIIYYLAHPYERDCITKAARYRILAEHTWEHRLKFILQKMHEIYG